MRLWLSIFATALIVQVSLDAQTLAPKAKSATPSEDEFVLRYQMQPGETLIYEVTHVGKTKTRVSGEE
ncbi:MAG: hypothetical protein AAF664_16780, partial [Planctomycetota bacterium]